MALASLFFAGALLVAIKYSRTAEGQESSRIDLFKNTFSLLLAFGLFSLGWTGYSVVYSSMRHWYTHEKPSFVEVGIVAGIAMLAIYIAGMGLTARGFRKRIKEGIKIPGYAITGFFFLTMGFIWIFYSLNLFLYWNGLQTSTAFWPLFIISIVSSLASFIAISVFTRVLRKFEMTISPIDIEETVIPAPLVENQVAADVPKEGTKTCPWCGTKNLDGATSCVNCASTLKRPS